jgi:hypothetical protein
MRVDGQTADQAGGEGEQDKLAGDWRHRLA